MQTLQLLTAKARVAAQRQRRPLPVASQAGQGHGRHLVVATPQPRRRQAATQAPTPAASQPTPPAPWGFERPWHQEASLWASPTGAVCVTPFWEPTLAAPAFACCSQHLTWFH